MRAKRKGFSTKVLFRMTLALLMVASQAARAQEAKTAYSQMFPLDQYLMERNAEITMARSAAPDSIAKDATVMILGRHGYETAVQGNNGFVCGVWRSWAAGIDDPEFWNPKVRAPICFNPAASRSYLVQVNRKTELLLAGKSKTETADAIHAALERKELPSIENGSMCYMMSKQGYLSDRDGHWHPHLMFFVPRADPPSWGANLPGSPVLGAEDKHEGLTVFLIPVEKWSDGSSGPAMEH